LARKAEAAAGAGVSGKSAAALLSRNTLAVVGAARSTIDVGPGKATRSTIDVVLEKLIAALRGACTPEDSVATGVAVGAAFGKSDTIAGCVAMGTATGAVSDKSEPFLPSVCFGIGGYRGWVGSPFGGSSPITSQNERGRYI
jgi:hypothetical protein